MDVDVLLICALKDEYDEVRKVTDGLQDGGWRESRGPKGWIVTDAVFASSDGAPLHIRATWANHMGREQTQAVASMLIKEQPTRCLAMSGICAGRRGKVSLGDVIFADRLWSCDAGKRVVEEDGKERFEGDTFQHGPLPVWVQRMQSVTMSSGASWLSERPALPLEHQESWTLLRLCAGEDPRTSTDFDAACPNWSEVLPRLWRRKWVEKPMSLTAAGAARAEELALLYPKALPPPPEFKVHVAPLATTAAVIEDSGIFDRLAISMRKVLGVEMEASALGAFGDAHGIPVVVAKGVSDYGDPFKDDRYRHFAARAAAECLIYFLRNSVDLIRPDVKLPQHGPGRGNVSALPLDLIEVLAEIYPDVDAARSVWVRAGGKRSEIESIAHPRDLWQRIWLKSVQGAAVRPAVLLRTVLDEAPNNTVIAHHHSLWQ